MDWKVCIITFNVAMKRASQEAVDALFEPLESAKPDVVVVGMQEVAHAESLGGTTFTWQRVMTDWMTMRGEMVFLAKNYQATNQITIFVRKPVLVSIRSIDFRYSRNTLGGLTGHKGSIGVRIALRNDTSLVFVDSHFVHDVAAYERRISQYASNTVCMFPEDSTVKSVFWLGDLNFRVELEPQEAMQMLKEGKEVEMLEERDQLRRAMRDRRVLVGFHEGEIGFKPTYRLYMGTTDYDLKRTPSWCDRILYRGSNIDSISYDSMAKVVVSDHFPVMGLFNVKVSPKPRPSTEWDTVFEHLPPWYSTVPLIGRFQLRNEYWKRKGSYMDWVGVFPAEIVDCTSPIRWLWVATCCDQMVGDQSYIVCEFPCLSAGLYRLGYFSNYSNCLVGLSKSFSVRDPSPTPTNN